jgi:hypothetical protein
MPHRHDALAQQGAGRRPVAGVQLATPQTLARHWTSDYDWRKAETKLNALPQFRTTIDGVDTHFIHVKSRHEHACR